MISALVVGCGGIGSDYDRLARPRAAPRSHAGAYAASPRTQLVAGVDPDPAARRRFAERWNVRVHARLDDALGAGAPVVASVCTPEDERLPIVEALVAAGTRAIWIEKPLAQSAAVGEQIVRACAAAGVSLQVNFLRRFDPLHRRVALDVRGRVLHADFRFSGTMENYGSHAIDLFRWLVGDPHQISQTGGVVAVATGDGRTGTFTRVIGTASRLFDCDLWLAERRVSLTALGEQLLVAEPEPSPLFADLVRPEWRAPDPQRGLEHAMSAGLDALLDHLELGSELLCTGADGVAELRVREALA